jgi:hypothetical protein
MVVQRARRSKHTQHQQQQSAQASGQQRGSATMAAPGASTHDAVNVKRVRSASADRQKSYSLYGASSAGSFRQSAPSSAAATYADSGHASEMRASKTQRLAGGMSVGRHWEDMGADEAGSRHATHASMVRDIRSGDGRDVMKHGGLVVDGDPDKTWVVGGKDGKRNSYCVPFLGARVRVCTKLGEGSSDAYFNATVGAYLPPTWRAGGSVGEEALWRVVFDHPGITPQDLDVDELLGAAALYTSFVRKRQCLEPFDRALSEKVTTAAATAAGKLGPCRSDGLLLGSVERAWGGGGGGSWSDLTKDAMGLWAKVSDGTGPGRSINPPEGLLGLGAGARELPAKLYGSITNGEAGEDRGMGKGFGAWLGLGRSADTVLGGGAAPGRSVDFPKLKKLDLEGMFVLRVLPDHGEVVGEITAKMNGGEKFEVSYESGAVEHLGLSDLATSLRAAMAMSPSDGWGVCGGGLVRRVCPTPFDVSAAQRKFLTSRPPEAGDGESGKGGAGGEGARSTAAAQGSAAEETVGVKCLNELLLRQERAALYVQMNDGVVCEHNGSLLLGRVCQLKPGKAKIHVSGFKVGDICACGCAMRIVRGNFRVV